MNEETKAALTEIAIMAIVVAVLGAGIVTAILVGTSASENAECIKWSQDAVGRPGYFLAQWQKDQCDAHGVIINAAVK